MTQSTIQAAIREFAPSWWGAPEVEVILSEMNENSDREDIAHIMWSMGAGLNHADCPYGGGEPADADYSNECDICQDWLLTASDKILETRA